MNSIIPRVPHRSLSFVFIEVDFEKKKQKEEEEDVRNAHFFFKSKSN